MMPWVVSKLVIVSYVGIRVTDIERSTKFYRDLFGMKVVKSGDFFKAGGGRYVLLADPKSGQRIELNWYPEGSKYASNYSPGEGLDHIGVKVDNVEKRLKELARKGVEIVPIPESLKEQKLGDAFTLHIGFVKDPDGNWIGLYDHPDGRASFDPDSY
jgi:lactoylglutathione lyase